MRLRSRLTRRSMTVAEKITAITMPTTTLGIGFTPALGKKANSIAMLISLTQTRKAGRTRVYLGRRKMVHANWTDSRRRRAMRHVKGDGWAKPRKIALRSVMRMGRRSVKRRRRSLSSALSVLGVDR
jgi:hypothetical protein